MSCIECGLSDGHLINCSRWVGYVTSKTHDNTLHVKVQSPVIKFKKMHPEATVPKIATDGSAGFDMTAITDAKYDAKYGVYSYDTGIAMEIPKSYVGLLVPRSSVYKTGLSLCNSCGIIDSDFRGLVSFKFYQMLWEDEDSLPKKGDRIGQLVVVPCLTLSEEVDELSDTARGSGGFGSTGV